MRLSEWRRPPRTGTPRPRGRRRRRPGARRTRRGAGSALLGRLGRGARGPLHDLRADRSGPRRRASSGSTSRARGRARRPSSCAGTGSRSASSASRPRAGIGCSASSSSRRSSAGVDAEADRAAAFALRVIAAIDGRPVAGGRGGRAGRGCGPRRAGAAKARRRGLPATDAGAKAARAPRLEAPAPTARVRTPDGRPGGRGAAATGRRRRVAAGLPAADGPIRARDLRPRRGHRRLGDLVGRGPAATSPAEHGRTWTADDRAAVMGANSPPWARDRCASGCELDLSEPRRSSGRSWTAMVERYRTRGRPDDRRRGRGGPPDRRRRWPVALASSSHRRGHRRGARPRPA